MSTASRKLHAQRRPAPQCGSADCDGVYSAAGAAQEAGGKIVGPCRVHAGHGAQALLAQVVQQVDQLASFLLPSGGADGPAHTPSAVLVLGEMNLAEILKNNSLTGQPTVECHRMPRLDIDDSGNVPLVDQRADPRSEVRRHRSGGAIDERIGALILKTAAIPVPRASAAGWADRSDRRCAGRCSPAGFASGRSSATAPQRL